MIGARRVRHASGPLSRAGAVLAVAMAVLVGSTGCAPTDAVAPEVRSAYAHAAGLSPQQAEHGERRDTEILRWAEELEIGDDTTLGETGEYGARDADAWSRYRDHIERRSQAIRDAIRDRLSLDDVRAYYRQHSDRFEKQDDLTLEVTEWQDDRAVSTATVEVDAASVRAQQEYDDQVISVALTLEEGEERIVDRGDGRYAQVRCLRRADAGTIPFEDVVQAAAGQLAAEAFEEELEKRIAAR